jgi:SAM-dependent methyltransferase
MLHFFTRREGKDKGDPQRSPTLALTSYILPKFLKRLASRQKPYVLDLGPLSGPNIEFFARLGFKIRVEDLLSPLPEEEASGGTAAMETATAPADVATPLPLEQEAPATSTAAARQSETPAAGRSGVAEAGAFLAGAAVQTTRPDIPPAASRASASTPDSGAGSGGGTTPASVPALTRPGARPSRRIVLPPRTFPRYGAGQGSGSTAHGPARGATGPASAAGPPLARRQTSFPYPDESFDAVIAWDLFNFYDPASVRLIASETRRILKPGGLVLAYFHARQAAGPDAPRRFRVVDERHVVAEAGAAAPQPRHVYQNRDIEKMFAGLTIVELYFLKNSLRELLMEKRAGEKPRLKPLVGPAAPKPPRFTIE